LRRCLRVEAARLTAPGLPKEMRRSNGMEGVASKPPLAAGLALSRRASNFKRFELIPHAPKRNQALPAPARLSQPLASNVAWWRPAQRADPHVVAAARVGGGAPSASCLDRQLPVLGERDDSDRREFRLASGECVRAHARAVAPPAGPAGRRRRSCGTWAPASELLQHSETRRGRRGRRWP
jgi:hypothetical protein